MAVNPIALVGRFFGRFFGNTIGEAAAYGIGGAMQEPIKPLLQQLANETWATATASGVARPVSAGEAAEIVAEDVELRDWGVAQAGQDGHTADQFDAILGATLNAPGLGPLFEAWRRDLIGDADFVHGLRKAKLEPRWDAPLQGLKQRLLSLEELANARQQGFVDDARQLAESDLQGLNGERAQILYELSGLPPGVETAQEALNRGLIDDAMFAQIVREGHTKTKYTDLLRELKQPLLSVTTYATLHLKGWITTAEMNAGGSLWGYTPDQMNSLYLSMGRPAAPGYMWTAAARGIDGPEGRPVDQAQFQKAIAESDIRPEYGPMLWGIRYTYPPLFQLNRLRQADAIDTATAVDWARKDRLAPEVVDALEKYWSGGTATATDTHVSKAQTQLWNRLHTSYLAGELDEQTALDTLPEAGVSAAAAPAVVQLWDTERGIVRKQLTPTQIRSALRKNVVNPATGAAWTRGDAIARLTGLGMSVNDANTFLDE